MDCSADLAALDRWFAHPMVTGDEKHDPISARDGLLERAVNRGPRLVEIVTVEVEDAIGLDIARVEPAVPTAIQRLARSGMRGGSSSAHHWLWRRWLCRWFRCLSWWG